MYDRLWEESPLVQKERAESLARGRAEGKLEGKLEGELVSYRSILVKIISMRFPTLVEVAQRRADQARKPGDLDLLIQQAVVVPDEQAAYRLLTLLED